MDPATLITAGASLVGAIFGRSKPKWVTPNYSDIRAKAEAAGFNPLTALQSAPGQAMDSGNAYMGQAIADAGAILADAVSKRKGAGLIDRLKQENATLKEKVMAATLRPAVGGIYARTVNVPSVRSSLRGSHAAVASSSDPSLAGLESGVAPVGGAVSGDSADLRPLSDQLPIDARRDVDNQKIPTHSGFMVIDNPAFGFPIYSPTLDGDEALGISDIPRVGVNVYGSYLYDRYRRNEAQPKRPSTDVYNPWLRGVPYSYNTHEGRQRNGLKPPYSVDQPYPNRFSDYWRWPKRADWPSFQLGR